MNAAPRYIFLRDRMEHLQLPLIALAIWALGLGAVGLMFGWVGAAAGLLAGAAVGSYAAFGRSALAIALRAPALVVAFGLSFLGGSR